LPRDVLAEAKSPVRVKAFRENVSIGVRFFFWGVEGHASSCLPTSGCLPPDGCVPPAGILEAPTARDSGARFAGPGKGVPAWTRQLERGVDPTERVPPERPVRSSWTGWTEWTGLAQGRGGEMMVGHLDTTNRRRTSRCVPSPPVRHSMTGGGRVVGHQPTVRTRHGPDGAGPSRREGACGAGARRSPSGGRERTPYRGARRVGCPDLDSRLRGNDGF